MTSCLNEVVFIIPLLVIGAKLMFMAFQLPFICHNIRIRLIPAEEQRHARQAQSRNGPLRQAQEAESIHEYRDQLLPTIVSPTVAAVPISGMAMNTVTT
jgi:hypothetical protein